MPTEKNFRQLLADNKPLKIVGAINAYSAILAERSGHKCIYLSGSGVASASYGIPDLGLTSLEDVLIDVRRISKSTSLPLLVDIDTGWGDGNDISHSIKKMIEAGAAAVHLEDQIEAKRCGHRPNKKLITADEMCERIKTAVQGRGDSELFIIARTDAFASEGINGCIKRARDYIDAGADGIFLEAITSLQDYKKLKDAIQKPILANITEFGKTPLFKDKELMEAGVDMMLFPLSAFRASSKAAEKVYESILKNGTQESVLDIMQTRDELYERLDYLNFEKNLDEYIKNMEKK
mgnify:FL=1